MASDGKVNITMDTSAFMQGIMKEIGKGLAIPPEMLETMEAEKTATINAAWNAGYVWVGAPKPTMDTGKDSPINTDMSSNFHKALMGQLGQKTEEEKCADRLSTMIFGHVKPFCCKCQQYAGLACGYPIENSDKYELSVQCHGENISLKVDADRYYTHDPAKHPPIYDVMAWDAQGSPCLTPFSGAKPMPLGIKKTPFFPVGIATAAELASQEGISIEDTMNATIEQASKKAALEKKLAEMEGQIKRMELAQRKFIDQSKNPKRKIDFTEE